MVDGLEIVFQLTIKYLSIITDARLMFKQHIATVSDKLARVGAVISPLMPNIGGLSQEQRLLLSSMITLIMSYKAPIWHMPC